MLESDVERYFREKIKGAGGMAVKFVSPGLSGVPDRIVLLPGGKIYFVELKKPGGRVRPLQKKVINKLRRLGQEVHIIKSFSEVDFFLRKVSGG